MAFEFSKYSGCGNDFILIDNRGEFFKADPLQIQQLCARCTGIGADGIILLENSAHSDFRMRIYNCDGFETEMCGNGIRCLMKFIQECGYEKQNCTIETFLRALTVTTKENLVTVEMGKPFDLRWNLKLRVEGLEYTVHHLNTGVPHLVYFTKELEQFNLPLFGPKFRHHPQLAPQGANFNVVQLVSNGELWIRTFERGVEKETLACGTGCAAAAIAGCTILGLSPPITVRTLSQEKLEIFFNCKNSTISDLTMTGPAVKTFSGKWNS